MVLEFFIQTLYGHKPNRILYSACFSSQFSRSLCGNAEDGSLLDRVYKEYVFYKTASMRIYSEDDYFSVVEDEKQVDLIHGAFTETIKDGKKLVVWQGGFACAFVMICEAFENVCQVQNILSLLVRLLQSKAQVLTQPNIIVSKPDRVGIVLKEVMPNGQILYINRKFIKHIEKAIDAKLSQ